MNDDQVIKSDAVIQREAAEVKDLQGGDSINPVTSAPLDESAPDTKVGDVAMTNDFRPNPTP